MLEREIIEGMKGIFTVLTDPIALIALLTWGGDLLKGDDKRALEKETP